MSLTKEQIKELAKKHPQLRRELQEMLKGTDDEGVLSVFTIDQTNMRNVRFGNDWVMRPLGDIDAPDLYQNNILLNTEKFDFKIKKIDGQDYLEITEKKETPTPQKLKESKSKKK